MKRRDFIRELISQGCRLDRHGSRHDIYENPRNGRKSSVPRHTELANSLCQAIRKQLEIQIP